MLIDFLIRENAVLSAVKEDGLRFFVLDLYDDPEFCLKVRPPYPLNMDKLVRNVFEPSVRTHKHVKK